MQTHVHVVIDLKVIFSDMAFLEQRVTLHQTGLQFVARLLGHAALGHLPRSKPLEDTADIHRTGDFHRADRTHLKSTPAKGHQQPFLLQRAERHAHRHARHAEQLGGRHLHQALAGSQLA